MADASLTLSQLLAERLIKVPGFQRGYAWGKDQLVEFLEDLDVLDAGDGAFRNHYTGTVILLARPDGATHMDVAGNVLAEVDVVDGQQRLTTIIILLAALARRLRAGNERLADGIVDRFVEVSLRDGGVVPKIQLAGTADEFFRNRILRNPVAAGLPATAAEERLLTALETLSKYVDGVAAKGADALPDLYEKLTQHLKFNEYVVESDTEAGVIFETVNARGKQLTELELVKNYLMFASNWVGRTRVARLEQAINETWAGIYQQLMEAELATPEREDQLLRAHWLFQYDPNVRFKGAKSVKERLSLRTYAQHPDDLADAILEYVESLGASAVPFCDLVKPDRKETYAQFPEREQMQARHAARKLNSAGNPGPFGPLLMAARLDPKIEPDEFVSLVKLSERLSFRLYRVLNARTDTAAGNLARAAYHLRHGELTADSAAERLKMIVHTFAPDARVFGALETESNWYNWWGLRYFLYEWEADLTGAQQMAHDWGDLDARARRKTIEHILPQAPTGKWLVDFPDAFERAELTHTLGNLMLTWDNERYSNKQYMAKRGGDDTPPQTACYVQASFKQENEVAARNKSNWTPTSIRERQTQLVDFARRRWAVELPRDPSEERSEGVEDIDGDRPGE